MFNSTLIGTVALTTSLYSFAADVSDSSPRKVKPNVVTATVSIGTSEVKYSTADSKEVLLTLIGSKETAHIRLPGDVGRITEIRACPWMDDGIALALETRLANGRRRYFWSTLRLDIEQKMFGEPVVDQFLDVEDDYDITGIVSSKGDSIYVVLSRQTRSQPAEEISGYVFVHNCPVGPIKGQLYRLRAEPAQVTE